jgi:hypothetical protein
MYCRIVARRQVADTSFAMMVSKTSSCSLFGVVRCIQCLLAQLCMDFYLGGAYVVKEHVSRSCRDPHGTGWMVGRVKAPWRWGAPYSPCRPCGRLLRFRHHVSIDRA